MNDLDMQPGATGESTLQALPAAQPGTDTIYIVQPLDSLSKIAEKFYGRADAYPLIAERNGIDPRAILYIGSRLVIPTLHASSAPASPGGSVPMEQNGQIIETVTTTAPRMKWYEDWRVWLAIGGIAGLLWYLNRNKR